jgi:hypothetical protein
MKTLRDFLLPFCFTITTIGLSGCGVTTPEIQEFWGDQNQAGAMESAIAVEIECELSNALKNIHEKTSAKTVEGEELRQSYDFVFDWNAQANFIFYVDEQTTVNPTLSFINSTQIFTLGLSGSNKTEAVRTDKAALVYKVRNLIKGPKYPCNAPRATAGTVFLTSDLRIEEWLLQALNLSVAQRLSSGKPLYPKKVDAISHDIKFEIVSSGGISPSWKLVRFGAGSSPLFSGSRDRYQDLLLTLGPPDNAHPDQLGPGGQTSVLSSQISNAINTSGRILP